MQNLRMTAVVMLTVLTAYSSATLAGPTELNIDQLSRITAGGANDHSTDRRDTEPSGGVIVANDSVATMTQTNSVSLMDNAQMGVQSLNLVNSSDSLIAGGFNVWDGIMITVVGPSGEGGSALGGATYLVSQTNDIVQDGRTEELASLSMYERSERTTQDTNIFVPPDEGEAEPTTIDTRSDRSPLFLQEAQAEYIVIDDSEIVVTNINEVALGGSAQQDANAVNLVNAAGSAVANGANVAVNITGALTPGDQMMDLSQANVVTQTR